MEYQDYHRVKPLRKQFLLILYTVQFLNIVTFVHRP